MEEIWKETEFKGYWVSNLGGFKNLNTYKDNGSGTNTLYPRGRIDAYGYRRVWIKNRMFFLHRLVAKAFVPGDFSLTINHKNGEKLDNKAVNLEWMSFGDNARHAHKNFKRNYVRGDDCGASKLKTDDVIEINILLQNGVSQYRIAKWKNVNSETIRNIARKRSWRHL